MNKTLRIAFADDERDVREYLQEVLPRLGHEVVAVASDGAELVSQSQRFGPDLVLTDIKMPGLDGIDVAAAINRTRPTPVILISAHHNAELLERLGGDYIMGYLIKPIGEPELRTSIALAMTRFRHFQTLAKEAADLRQALEDRKLIEKAKGIVMKRLRVDEEEAFRRLRKLASDHNLKLVEAGKRISSAEEIFQQLERL
jgi:response regulator NasT